MIPARESCFLLSCRLFSAEDIEQFAQMADFVIGCKVSFILLPLRLTQTV